MQRCVDGAADCCVCESCCFGPAQRCIGAYSGMLLAIGTLLLGASVTRWGPAIGGAAIGVSLCVLLLSAWLACCAPATHKRRKLLAVVLVLMWALLVPLGAPFYFAGSMYVDLSA